PNLSVRSSISSLWSKLYVIERSERDRVEIGGVIRPHADAHAGVRPFGRRARVDDLHLGRVDVEAESFLAVGALPRAGGEASFDVDSPPLAEVLAAHLAQLP